MQLLDCSYIRRAAVSDGQLHITNDLKRNEARDEQTNGSIHWMRRDNETRRVQLWSPLDFGSHA